MRIFIDSANIEEIREINALGFLEGVTTNPTLVAREGRNYHQVIREICGLVDGPVSAEAIAVDYHAIMEESRQLAGLHPNVVVKIPITENGLRAISTLAKEGIATNATLVFSCNQALLAARAGATYVSPFVGRIDDISYDGLAMLEDLIAILDQYMLDTEVIAASIRHPRHVAAAARLGIHIATVPYAVIKQMIKHPLTDAGIEKFLNDWKKAFERAK
ncbi:MAG: fructose-6-phosphate aldolase [Syntrophomonadaceae bacterium]